MPVNVTYPGVYIDEVKSSVRTITGVPTSVAAFVGYAPRGPADRPVHITGWADYEAVFGGLQTNCPMSYAVYQFYLNGGSEAEIVRVVKADEKPVTLPLAFGPPPQEAAKPPATAAPAAAADSAGGEPAPGTSGNATPADDKKKKAVADSGAKASTSPSPSPSSHASAGPAGAPTLVAASPGRWGLSLRARVDHDTQPVPDEKDRKLFNLTVRDMETGAEERYLNISVEPGSLHSLGHLLESSQLVRAPDAFDAVPEKSLDPDPTQQETDPFKAKAAGGKPCYYAADEKSIAADDETKLPAVGDYEGSEAKKTGLHQLLKTDIFNILCLPDAGRMDDEDAKTLRTKAQQLCVQRRAVLLVDPPKSWTDAGDLDTVIGKLNEVQGNESDKNAAVYYPRILAPDPLRGGPPRPFPPSGVMAGVLARTDVQRGVWKAPAGTDASLTGVSDLEVPLTDLEIGRLNPLGVNCLRRLPAAGPVAWGARTLRGADRLADEWKYLPVRRLALFIEESLFRGTQWVVFEPNDEPLWASVRLNVGAFMNSMFRAGAFQGRTPTEAYLVKCDKDTNPQNDIDRGIVNIHVGFAPLKPAEFVIVHIQQLAGQIQV
ncbi:MULTISPECIES: phage tail sheath subtilisin-like domain-containing protein [unclassified Streptomyces]|uniref:phage tail sheath family protein n=1 Tax=unclassified Streptomyces TaxID=2593676 RepID=UPI00331C9EBC